MAAQRPKQILERTFLYAPSVLPTYAYRYAPTAPPSGSFGGSSNFGSLRTGEDGRSVRFLLSLALFTRARSSMSVTPSAYGTGSNERPLISSHVRHPGHWQPLLEPMQVGTVAQTVGGEDGPGWAVPGRGPWRSQGATVCTLRVRCGRNLVYSGAFLWLRSS